MALFPRSPLLAILFILLLALQPILSQARRLIPPTPRRAASKSRLPSPVYGVVVSPLDGSYFSPAESFHFQYALATKQGSVTVVLVNPALEDRDESRITVSCAEVGAEERSAREMVGCSERLER